MPENVVSLARKWEKEKKKKETKKVEEEASRKKLLEEHVPPSQRFQRTAPKKLEKKPDVSTTSWNNGFKRQTQPKDTYVKRQIDSMGRESVEHAKIPEEPEEKPKEDIERARFEHQRRVGKQSMDLKAKPKGEPVQINKNIGKFIDDTSLVLTDGSDEELNEAAAELKSILEKYGHHSLSNLIAANPTRENFETAITAINKRRGIAETKGPRLPDLIPGRITRKDGVTQTVYHLPTVGKKKLKIRPGFSKEVLIREHGQEGFEGQKVIQTMWKKDKDFTKKGIISMGDWEYDPNREIRNIEKVEYDEGEKGVPSAIVDYDDFRAYVKHDTPIKLRREYGVSKFFNTSTLIDELGFSIPRSSVIDVEKLGSEDVAGSVNAKEGQVIHNEFIDGYPLSLFEGTEMFDKVDKQKLSDAIVFNKLIGNKSFNLNNILVDDDGNLVLVDSTNTLNNTLNTDNETYEMTFDNWEVLDEELMKNSLDKIQKMEFEDFVIGLLQNTQIDDAEFDKYSNILRENFELMNTHLYGTPEEIEALQTWWDREREGRIQLEAEEDKETARTTLAELKEDELKAAFMDTVRGKTDRVDEIMIALEEKVRDRLSEEIREQVKKDALSELKEQYDLVPKEKDIVEEKPEHTMEDLFLVNQQRREAGLNPYQSIEEMEEAEKAPDEDEVEEPAKDIRDFKWKFTPSEHTLFLDDEEENNNEIAEEDKIEEEKKPDIYEERREEIKNYFLEKHIPEDDTEIDFVDYSDDYIKVLNYDNESDRYIFDIDADVETHKQVLIQAEKMADFDWLKYEQLVVFDDTGKKIYTSGTNKESEIIIEPDDVHYLKGGTLLHNHPNDDATFSKSDIMVLIGTFAKELLVTTVKEGKALLYSIKPPEYGWEEGAKSIIGDEYNNEYNKFYKENNFSFDLAQIKNKEESEQATRILEHTMKFIANKFGIEYTEIKLQKVDNNG